MEAFSTFRDEKLLLFYIISLNIAGQVSVTRKPYAQDTERHASQLLEQTRFQFFIFADCSEWPQRLQWGLPFHSNSSVTWKTLKKLRPLQSESEFLICKYVQKIYRHLLMKHPILEHPVHRTERDKKTKDENYT